MLVIPALDIMDRSCVRLTRGAFDSKKIYFRDPIRVAREFEKSGASMLHIVDLDGAKCGNPINCDLILAIRRTVDIPLEVGGGIRTLSAASFYLSHGIDRVVLGTRALSFPFLRSFFKKFGKNRLIVSLDLKNGKIASFGWQKTSPVDWKWYLECLKSLGISEIITTDIMRDGTLQKPNFTLLQKIRDMGFSVIAAGGVSDISSLRTLQRLGASGAIIGKALYERKIDLSSAIRSVRPFSNLLKRIIPCLDVKDGKVVKGVRFQNFRDCGDPVKLAKKYSEEGADELVFLDITATRENRGIFIDLIKKIAAEIRIPFTVGGGIRSLEDIRRALHAGADKIAINSAAVRNPALISMASQAFGTQCIVLAMDVKKTARGCRVFIDAGHTPTRLDPCIWAREAERLGAGEILLTSMDADGTRDGYDLKILAKISRAVRIPVIASGGAGTLDDFKNAFIGGTVDAVLAANVFHSGRFSIRDVKKYLRSHNISTRL